MKKNDWMTTDEVAKKLGVTQNTVRTLYEKDGVKVLRLGRKLRIRREDFEAMFDKRFGPYDPNK